MIDVLRPATPGALKPDQIELVVGHHAQQDIKFGQELTWLEIGQ